MHTYILSHQAAIQQMRTLGAKSGRADRIR